MESYVAIHQPLSFLFLIKRAAHTTVHDSPLHYCPLPSQALMYPLLVATKSQSPSRRTAAYAVLEQIRQHNAALVEQVKGASTGSMGVVVASLEIT